jgi:hypothetical protein
MAPGSFAQRTAQNYEGTAWQAAGETFLFAATTVAGGPLGRAAGKAAAPFVGRKAIREAEEKIIAENATKLEAQQAGREKLAEISAAAARDGFKLGVGAGAVVGNYAAENWQKPVVLLQGAWQQGEQWASGLLPGQPQRAEAGLPQPQPQQRTEAGAVQQPQRAEAGLPQPQPQQQPRIEQPQQPQVQPLFADQGTVFAGQSGRSSIEKLLGGQKATPPQAQPAAAQQPSIKTEDLPKPS